MTQQHIVDPKIKNSGWISCRNETKILMLHEPDKSFMIVKAANIMEPELLIAVLRG